MTRPRTTTHTRSKRTIATALLLAFTVTACSTPTQPSASTEPAEQQLAVGDTTTAAVDEIASRGSVTTQTLAATATTVDGWSSVTGFRRAETAVQRNIVQEASAANGESSGRSMMGPPWLTDTAGGDGERMRIAITRWYDHLSGRLPGMTAAQVQAQMKRDLSATYDATRQTALVNRIVEVWERRFSIIGPPAPPPRQGDNQGVMDFMGIRKQCLEWADTLAQNAGGRGLTYSAAAVSASAARPGMGLFHVGVHAMIIVDIEWRGGVPVRFKVAEANWANDWMNPNGQIPWQRVVSVGRIVGTGYRIVSFG